MKDRGKIEESAPLFSQHPDTESLFYLVPIKIRELGILWPGTRAPPEDGFSFNDFKTNLDFRMLPSAVFPGKDIELHTGFERRYLVSRTHSTNPTIEMIIIP